MALKPAICLTSILFTKAKGKKKEGKDLEFFMDMIPPTATHQQKGCTFKNGKRIYYNRANGDAEEKLKAYLAKHIPKTPFKYAIRLEVKWCFPINDVQTNGEPYTKKPDVDNLCKALLDIMTKLGFWKDDKQVYELYIGKYYSERPGIYIRISEVADTGLF